MQPLIQELEALTSRLPAVNIVGGGSKDSYLNELTAKGVWASSIRWGLQEGTARDKSDGADDRGR